MSNNSTTENLKKQFRENKQLRMITYAIAGVVVVMGGYLAYRQFIFAPHNEKSRESYYEGLNYAAKDSTDKAIPSLEAAVKKYDGTEGGENAQFVLARQYMAKGNFKKALEALDDVDVDDTYLRVYTIGLQGDCYSEMGKYEDALDKYEDAAATNENEFTSPEFLFKAALVAEQLADFEKATDLYKKIRDNYERFASQKSIEKYIARSENKIKK